MEEVRILPRSASNAAHLSKCAQLLSEVSSLVAHSQVDYQVFRSIGNVLTASQNLAAGLHGVAEAQSLADACTQLSQVHNHIRETTCERLFNNGVSALNASRLAEAVWLNTTLLELKPDCSEARLNRAVALSRMKKYQLALDDLSEFIQANPDVALGYAIRGDLWLSQDAWSHAIQDFHRAVALTPRDDKAWYCLGEAYQGSNQITEALSAYTRCLELNPAHVVALLNRGCLRALANEGQQAIDDWTRALNLPESAFQGYTEEPGRIRARLFCSRSNVLGKANRAAEAFADLQSAVACMPPYADAHDRYAIRLRAEGRVGEAIHHVDIAVSVDPSNAQILFHRSVIRRELGDLDGARVDCKESLRIDPGNGDAWESLGNICRDVGDIAKALNAYTEAVRLSPSNSQVYCNRGVAYESCGQREEALQDYNAAIAYDGANCSAFINRALLWQRPGRLDAAERDFATAIALEPERAATYYNRALLRRRQRQLEAALDDLNYAISLDPQLALSYSEKASVLSELARHSEAIASGEESVGLTPNNPWSRITLANARFRADMWAMGRQDLRIAKGFLEVLVERQLSRGQVLSSTPDTSAARALMKHVCPMLQHSSWIDRWFSEVKAYIAHEENPARAWWLLLRYLPPEPACARCQAMVNHAVEALAREDQSEGHVYVRHFIEDQIRAFMPKGQLWTYDLGGQLLGGVKLLVEQFKAHRQALLGELEGFWVYLWFVKAVLQAMRNATDGADFPYGDFLTWVKAVPEEQRQYLKYSSEDIVRPTAHAFAASIQEWAHHAQIADLSQVPVHILLDTFKARIRLFMEFLAEGTQEPELVQWTPAILSLQKDVTLLLELHAKAAAPGKGLMSLFPDALKRLMGTKDKYFADGATLATLKRRLDASESLLDISTVGGTLYTTSITREGLRCSKIRNLGKYWRKLIWKSSATSSRRNLLEGDSWEHASPEARMDLLEYSQEHGIRVDSPEGLRADVKIRKRLAEDAQRCDDRAERIARILKKRHEVSKGRVAVAPPAGLFDGGVVNTVARWIGSAPTWIPNVLYASFVEGAKRASQGRGLCLPTKGALLETCLVKFLRDQRAIDGVSEVVRHFRWASVRSGSSGLYETKDGSDLALERILPTDVVILYSCGAGSGLYNESNGTLEALARMLLSAGAKTVIAPTNTLFLTGCVEESHEHNQAVDVRFIATLRHSMRRGESPSDAVAKAYGDIAGVEFRDPCFVVWGDG